MIEGTVAPGFEGVREAFERCFGELGETGAGFCALVDGHVVADLRGGLAPDGLVHLYSVSKPAAEAPWFPPGSTHAEHALFYGHLCGELVRRADGRTLGAFWREEVAGPWRLDVHFGLTDAELTRAVDLEGDLPPAEGGLYEQALGNPPGARDLAVVNAEEWRRAEVPAINAHATAHGVARFFEGVRAGGTLDGVRLVSPATAAAMHAGELRARDELLEEEVCWGLGVWVEPDGFGMGGIGGSLGMADPQLGLAEAYVTRHMADHDRADAMDAALREALSRR